MLGENLTPGMARQQNWRCRRCRCAYQEANKEAKAEYDRAHYAANKEAIAERHRAYREANKEARAEYQRAHREANPDRAAARGGWNAARERGGLIPPDFESAADLITATQPFYERARRLTKETGTQHHVDHIFPLIAGGLHHPSNLQVLTAHENAVKAGTDTALAEHLRAAGHIGTAPELADLDYDEEEAAEIEAWENQSTGGSNADN